MFIPLKVLFLFFKFLLFKIYNSTNESRTGFVYMVDGHLRIYEIRIQSSFGSLCIQYDCMFVLVAYGEGDVEM